jgi:hypothetical protein
MPIVEVPDDAVDDLPDSAEERDNLLTQEEVDDVVQTRLNRQERNLRSELRTDEEFLQEAMQQAFGVELREDGRPKGAPNDDEVEELRKKASRVDELEEKLSEYESQIEQTRETELENQLRQSASGVREDMDDVFMTYARQRMTYTDEYGWVETDENGDVVYEGGQPKGPEQVVSEMEETKPGFFRESSMSDGPDSTPTDDASGPSQVSKSEFDEMPPDRQKEVALDEGTEIVPD